MCPIWGPLLLRSMAHEIRWPLVVARLGANLEDLDRYGQRYAVSRTVAGRATRLVGVCDGTSVGLLRFFDWLVDVTALADDTPIDVVVNRCPTSSAARAQLLQQLREVAGPRIGDVVMCRRDKRVERAAWDASLVSRGSFIKAIGSLPFDSTIAVTTRVEVDAEAAA